MTEQREFFEELAVPDEHASYAGHFPGHPLVPGALLLQWLQARVEAAMPGWQVREVPSIKFRAEVHPGAILTLAGRFDTPKARLSLTVTCEENPVCTASFLLGRCESP